MSEKVIPEGLDPHAFREKVVRAIDAEPDGSAKKGTLKRKLKAVDEELSLAEPDGEAPKKKASKKG